MEAKDKSKKSWNKYDNKASIKGLYSGGKRRKGKGKGKGGHSSPEARQGGGSGQGGMVWPDKVSRLGLMPRLSDEGRQGLASLTRPGMGGVSGSLSASGVMQQAGAYQYQRLILINGTGGLLGWLGKGLDKPSMARLAPGLAGWAGASRPGRSPKPASGQGLKRKAEGRPPVRAQAQARGGAIQLYLSTSGLLALAAWGLAATALELAKQQGS